MVQRAVNAIAIAMFVQISSAYNFDISAPIPRTPTTKASSAASQTRRSLFAATAAGAWGLSAATARAEPANTQTYSDPAYGISFTVPASWTKVDSSLESGPGGGASRKLLLWVDPEDPDTNAFLAYTPVRGDYTALSSFGSIDSVAQTVVPNGPGIDSELVQSKTANQFYYFDYKVQPDPKDKMRRLKTVFAIAHSDSVSTPPDMLVTFTSQTTQAKFDSDASAAAVIGASLDSFKISAPKK